jgi:hypothetical protein
MARHDVQFRCSGFGKKAMALLRLSSPHKMQKGIIISRAEQIGKEDRDDAENCI